MKALLLIIVLSSCAKLSNDYSITGEVFGHMLTITTSNEFAGGVKSFKWKDKEFLTDYDHGRGMQATFRTKNGECFNPTESGAFSDYKDGSSTSVLKDIYTHDNYMSTTTQMAYWLSNTDTYVVNCPLNAPRTAGNLSNEILKKTIKIGIPGHENVIELTENFYIAEDNLDSLGAFEGVTNYTNGEFNTFYRFDRVTEKLVIKTGDNYSHDPLVVATLNGEYAIGSVIIELPNVYDYEYLSAAFADGYQNGAPTTIWSNVFYIANIQRGWYTFKTDIVIGNLEQVRETISKLLKELE